MQFDDYTTDSMCSALEQLSHVAAFDYGAASFIALAGTSANRMRNAAGRAGLTGQLLAFDLWSERMRATVALRKKEAA